MGTNAIRREGVGVTNEQNRDTKQTPTAIIAVTQKDLDIVTDRDQLLGTNRDVVAGGGPDAGKGKDSSLTGPVGGQPPCNCGNCGPAGCTCAGCTGGTDPNKANSSAPFGVENSSRDSVE